MEQIVGPRRGERVYFPLGDLVTAAGLAARRSDAAHCAN